jgi:hypothetical protein
MGLTEKISVFTNRTIAKNASIVLGTPIYLGKCAPETKFWADLELSGAGNVAVTYQVGDTPDDTFYKPPSATTLRASFDVGRDRFCASLLGAPWIKFKAKEANASPVVLSMGLIISQN